MKKSFSLCLTFITLLSIFTFALKTTSINVKAKEEISRIDLTLDQEKFDYYFNVAFTEGEMDSFIDEIIDSSYKDKYYIDKNNTYIMYCYNEEVKDEYYGYYGTGDGTEKLKENTTYVIKFLLYTDDYSFGENLQVYLNDELQDPLHNYSDTSYYNRFGDYGVEFRISIGMPSTEKIVTGIEVSEEEKQIVKGENDTFTATVLGNTDDKTVDWSLTGNTSASTVVSNGVVTIGEDETAETLTLKAAAHAKPSIYKEIKIYVLSEAPYIESVVIGDITQDQNAGSYLSLNATVTGTHINKEVEWSIEGANSLNTYIDEYGQLLIAIDETSTQITVVATSKVDDSKKDSIVFNVTPAQKIEEINIILDQNVINDYLLGNYTEDLFQEEIRLVTNVSNGLILDTSNTFLTYEFEPNNFYGIGSGDENVSKDRQYAIKFRIRTEPGYVVTNDHDVFKLNGVEIEPKNLDIINSGYNSQIIMYYLINPSDTVSVTVENVEGGIASANRSEAVAGSQVTLSVTPDSNYFFKEWKVVSGNVEIVDNKFIMGNEPVVIQPVYVPAYQVIIISNGPGTTLCKDRAAEGEEVIIDLYPNSGYMVKSIEVISGDVVLDGNVFIMGNKNVVINIVYSKILYLTITGNEDVSKGHVSVSTDFGTEGTVVTLTPTAQSGYQFVKYVVVSGGITIEDNKFTFGMEDVVIYAVFEALKGISVVGNQYGTATADMDDALPGTTVTLTATPNQNCKFIEWVVVNGDVEIENNQFIMGSEAVSIRAEFRPIVNVTVINDGNGTGKVDVASGVEGDVLALTATPNQGYVFKEWVITEGVASVKDNSLTLGLTDVTVKAVFERLYKITITNDENGTAVADYSEAKSGTLVKLTATPKEGYYLKEYQVLAGGITVSVDEFVVLENDIEIKAIFESEHICKPQLVKKVEPTCTSEGKEAYYKCSCGICYEDENGETIINNISTWGILPIEEHKFDGDWEKDENNHWKECTCGEEAQKAAHTPNIPNATETQDKVCTECGYVIEEALGHEHKFDGDWEKDENNHWKECTCGEEAQKAAHTPNIPNATEIEDKVCTECGYVIEEALGHEHKFDGDWEKDENNHWKECTCGEEAQKAAHVDSNSDYSCDTCGRKLPEPPKEEGGCNNSTVIVMLSLFASLSFVAYALLKRNK